MQKGGGDDRVNQDGADREEVPELILDQAEIGDINIGQERLDVEEKLRNLKAKLLQATGKAEARSTPPPNPPVHTTTGPSTSTYGNVQPGQEDGWCRRGRWNNALVRGAQAGGDPHPRPLKKVARLEPHVRLDAAKLVTRREVRERENTDAIGGMRNPAASVSRLPRLRLAGRRVHDVIDKFIADHTEILEDVQESIVAGKDLIGEQRVEELAKLVGAALGAPHHRRGHTSVWRPGIVQAFVDCAGDPESMLAKWLDAGAPTGVAHDVESVGIFPRTEAKGQPHAELWRHWARFEPTANYASVKENQGLVAKEIERLSESGFVTIYEDWEAVLARFGNVVVSKMAAVSKVKEDGQ